MERGLIFIATHPTAFSIARRNQIYENMNVQKYEEWKQQKMQTTHIFEEHEPVAFFSFEGQNELSIKIDSSCNRPCKYIFLKTTGFAPQHENVFQSHPCEFKYFGVQGSIIDEPECLDKEANQFLASQKQAHKLIKTDINLKIQVQKLGSTEWDFLADQQVTANETYPNINFDPELNRSSNPNNIMGSIKIAGLSDIIHKIKVTQDTPSSPNWVLRNLTIQVLIADD